MVNTTAFAGGFRPTASRSCRGSYRRVASRLRAAEDVLRGGSSDLGAPDKAPPCRVEGRSKPGKKRLPVSAVPSRRTLQVINVWKADSLFRSLRCRRPRPAGSDPRGGRAARAW